jgi:hypothetical protein
MGKLVATMGNMPASGIPTSSGAGPSDVTAAASHFCAIHDDCRPRDAGVVGTATDAPAFFLDFALRRLQIFMPTERH